MAYSFPKDDAGITDDLLAKSPPEIQKAVMKAWFFEHYEHPAESTPYDSEEGGYVYIWGGPYDALEELEEEFSGTVPDEVIEELASELTNTAREWSGIPEYDDSDDYLAGAIQANVDPRRTATEALAKIHSLLAVQVSSELELPMYRLLYVNAIACLEAYLCDTFMNRVLSDDELKQRLVETSHDFKQEKIPIATIYKHFAGLNDRLREYLFSTLWHNLPRAKGFYKSVLEMDFPEILGLAQAVEKRHDIVHRNGKTKDGEEVFLNKADVENLIREVEVFIGAIEERLPSPPF
jgi:hypothetical protein